MYKITHERILNKPETIKVLDSWILAKLICFFNPSYELKINEK